MTTVHRPEHADARRPAGLPETFAWTRQPTGLTLWCEPIGELAHHGWTTVDLPMPAGADHGEAWARIAEAAGVTPGRVARLRQVHGAGVHRAEAGAPEPVEADAAIARDVGVALAVQVADCVPLLLLDPHGGAVAAIHAGWRGLAAGVIGAAVGRLVADFAADAEGLIAGVGPSIGPCCYRVGPELREAFVQAGWPADHSGTWFRDGDDLRLDLWQASRDQLVAAGLAGGRVHVSRLCTSCHPEWFASYRRDGKAAGRQVGFIRPAAVTSAGA